MTEPTTTTAAGGYAGAALVTLFSVAFGEQLGPIATIAAAGLVGAIVSLGEVPTATTREAVLYVLRFAAMAVVITSGVAYLVETYLHLSAVNMLALVAFGIGWVGGRWARLRDVVLNTLASIVGRKGDPS